MNKLQFSILVFVFAVISFTSCSSKTENSGTGGTEASTVAAKYSCPMHPEVVSDEPGKCSECGMELAKMEEVETDTTSHEGHNH